MNSSCDRFAVPNSHFVSESVRSMTLASVPVRGSGPFPSVVVSAHDNRGWDRVFERTCDGPVSPGATPIENVMTTRSVFSFPGGPSKCTGGTPEGASSAGLGLLLPSGAPTLPKITSRFPRGAFSTRVLASNTDPIARYPATASDSCGGGGRAIIVGGGSVGWAVAVDSPSLDEPLSSCNT